MSKGLRISLQGTFTKECFEQAFELMEQIKDNEDKPFYAFYSLVSAHPNTIELSKRLADAHKCFPLQIKVDLPKFYKEAELDYGNVFEYIARRGNGYLTITDKIREQVAVCHGSIVSGSTVILPPEPYLECAVRYKDIYRAFREIHGICPTVLELKG